MTKHLLAATLVALCLVGCKSQPKPKEGTAAAKSAVIAERVEGTSPWKVALALQPAQPANGKPENLRFTVTDAAGKPAAGLNVTVALVMPLMDMGKNEFPAKETSPGVYEGTGTFAMADEWEVFLTLKQGDQQARHVFNVRVGE
jgi:uncharacterized lipoprotein NlpE involved in copper resistance